MIDIWSGIIQYGSPFLLFVGVIAFYTGRIVSGDAARSARNDEVAEIKAQHRTQVEAFRERYEEMNAVWRERYTEVAKDRNELRSLATSLAQQAQQGISAAEQLVTRRTDLGSSVGGGR